MATIITKNSSTASSVPTAAQLVKGELAVNVTDKRLFTEDNSGNVVELGTNPSSLTLPNGTANGVAYLNGSKVLTTGSALTYNGTGLGVGVASASFALDVGGSDGTNIALRSTGTSSARLRAYVNGAESGVIGFLNGGGQFFEVAGSEQMRLTSTGLGIGTSSILQKLTVSGNAAIAAASFPALKYYDNSSNLKAEIYYGVGGSDLNLVNYAAGPIIFKPNNTEAMRIDSSGNLGLGVTPSAWSSVAMEIGYGGNALWGLSVNDFRMSTNLARISGGNQYKANGAAALYNQASGGHYWYTAPSGTAGNAISFTQAMTLDASGNLMIGTTTSSGLPLTVNGGAKVVSTAYNSGGLLFGTTANSDDWRIGDSGASTYALTFSSMSFGVSTERARITSGGEVYIAGTTDQGAYNLQVNGTGVWGAGAYVNGSDVRLKENVQTLTDGLSVVTKLRPVTFQYKAEYSKDTAVQPGFIAQELQQAMAGKDYVDGVVQSGPEYLNVAYQSLIPVLVKAIQELKAELDSVKTELATLKGN